MACLRYSQSVTEACRDAQPGVTKIFIGNYSDITSYSLDTAGTSITGLTLTGSTKFYEVAQNKQVASFIDTPTINLQNGVAISKPKVSFKVQGLTSTTLQMYKELMQADVAVVVKTIDGQLYGVGFANGLSMSVGTLGSEAQVDGFIGASFELEGIEASPFYIIAPTLNFESSFVA